MALRLKISLIGEARHEETFPPDATTAGVLTGRQSLRRIRARNIRVS